MKQPPISKRPCGPRGPRQWAMTACSAAAFLCAQVTAQAQGAASELSALSMLPMAVSVAGPALVLSAGASLTVVAIEASAEATVWVLERAFDGARCSLRVSGQVAGALSVSVGSAVLVTALGTGWLISAAGRVLAFVPNELGAALLYNERITR